jgi:hypothetical protein
MNYQKYVGIALLLSGTLLTSCSNEWFPIVDDVVEDRTRPIFKDSLVVDAALLNGEFQLESFIGLDTLQVFNPSSTYSVFFSAEAGFINYRESCNLGFANYVAGSNGSISFTDISIGNEDCGPDLLNNSMTSFFERGQRYGFSKDGNRLYILTDDSNRRYDRMVLVRNSGTNSIDGKDNE